MTSHTKCGWLSIRPRWLQKLNSQLCFLIVICLAAFFQGSIINGFVNVALTSIETRFGVSSKKVGFIPSSYDLAGILCVIPLSYFGGRTSQTRILGICLLISSVGAFVMFLPHILTLNESSTMDALKDAGVTRDGFCGSSANIDEPANLEHWVGMFYLGMMIMGVGFCPLWTNTFDYMDKNLSHKNFSVYAAIFSLAGILGPGFGYIVGGVLLRYPFDDVTKSSSFYKNLSDSEYEELTENEGFIGAYWIGFILSAIGLFLIALPVGAFPYEFPNSQKIREKKKNEAFGAKTQTEEATLSKTLNWKDFQTGMLYVLKNPIAVAIAFAGATEGFFLASVSSFGPKLLEVSFNLTSSDAAFTIGYILIPTATLALIIGGLIPKVFSFSNQSLLLFCVVCSFVTFASTFGFFFSCGQSSLIAPEDVIQFKGSTCDITSCGCSLSSYKPFCLDKKYTVFSPCFYGCSNDNLTSCSCYDSSLNFDLSEGSCEISEFCSESNFYLLQLFLAISSFSVFLNLPSAEAALDRSVLPNFRSLAFGFDIFIMRLFGTIPATLVVGAMFDGKCNLWQIKTNGEKGTCLRYEESVASAFTAICIVATGSMTILFLTAFLFEKFKRNKPSSNSVTPTHSARQISNDDVDSKITVGIQNGIASEEKYVKEQENNTHIQLTTSL